MLKSQGPENQKTGLVGDPATGGFKKAACMAGIPLFSCRCSRLGFRFFLCGAEFFVASMGGKKNRGLFKKAPPV